VDTASAQSVIGLPACFSIDHTASSTVQLHLSKMPFCCCEYGDDTSLMMPSSAKYSRNFSQLAYSTPPSIPLLAHLPLLVLLLHYCHILLGHHWSFRFGSPKLDLGVPGLVNSTHNNISVAACRLSLLWPDLIRVNQLKKSLSQSYALSAGKASGTSCL